MTYVLRGAEEACWAHNPKVLGSKPSGATWMLCVVNAVQWDENCFDRLGGLHFLHVQWWFCPSFFSSEAVLATLLCDRALHWQIAKLCRY